MNIQKSLLFVSLLLISICSFSSCKKESNKLTTINFHLFNPVTGEVFSGVKVKILLKEEKSSGPFVLGNKYVSSTLWEGVTDLSGKVSFSFNAYSNNKYQYWQVVDESLFNVYDAIIQPTYESLNKDQENTIEYQLTKKVNYIRWIKNVNFVNSNDKFSFRLKEILFPNKEWSAWTPYGQQTDKPTSFFEGNFEIMSSLITEGQNIYEVEMVTIRNGITTTKIDTFYLNGIIPVDTMKLFY